MTRASDLQALHTFIGDNRDGIAEQIELVFKRVAPRVGAQGVPIRLALIKSLLACLEHAASGAPPEVLHSAARDIAHEMHLQDTTLLEAMCLMQGFLIGLRRAAHALDPKHAVVAVTLIEDVLLEQLGTLTGIVLRSFDDAEATRSLP